MAALCSSFSVVNNPQIQFLSGSSLKPSEQCVMSFGCYERYLSSNFQGKARITTYTRPHPLMARASVDSGRPSRANVFVGGFVLGGLVVAALGCVYAPQLSKVLAGDERKEFMRKLPKFIYDEEKALEKTRKTLTQKIAELNSAIDGISSQLRADDAPNGSAVESDEVKASL